MQDAAKLKRELGILEVPRDLDVRLKLRFSGLRRLLIGFLYDRGSTQGLSFWTRLRLWRRGFSAVTHRLNRLDANPWFDYLSDSAAMDDVLVHRHRAAVNDKLSQSYLFERQGVGHPRVLSFIRSGHLLVPGTGGEQSAAEWLEALPETEQRLVFKPVSGLAGFGLFFLRWGLEGATINGTGLSHQQVVDVISSLDQYLVTEFAEQAEYARTIFGATPNTVRLLTLWDVDAGSPFVAAAVHRFGSVRSGLVDNFHQGRGGLSAAVCLDDGMLGPGAWLVAGGRVEMCDVHPDSSVRIEGVHVPHWQRVLAEATRLAAALPQVPYIGWDLIVTESGPSWIEANCPPSVAPWQVHHPLLADPRARAFYASLNMK